MYFEVYNGDESNVGMSGASSAADWRWRLKAANHEIIAQGEGYTSKQNCLHAVDLLKQTTIATPVKDI